MGKIRYNIFIFFLIIYATSLKGCFMDCDFVRKIYNIIQHENENDQVDFKQVWHDNNERLLHDILCFANTAHNFDCYIIIGVSDEKRIVGVNNLNRKKQADLLDMLSHIFFAGDYTPRVNVDTLQYGDREIDVITIYNSFDVPYYIQKRPDSYKNIREGHIYVRHGDKNTPMCQNASLPDIEILWKKRLGLTLPPMEQIRKRLRNKLEWISSIEGYYNIYKPEYQLVYEEDDDDKRLKGEFYIYTQENSGFYYSNIKIMFNMDSGRYTTPVPELMFLGKDEQMNIVYKYRYYLKDSFCYQLQQFLFNESDYETIYEKNCFDEVILYFDDAKEKEAFEVYVLSNKDTILKYLEEAGNHYYTIDSDNERGNKEARKLLSIGLALNKALIQYRKEIAEN